MFKTIVSTALTMLFVSSVNADEVAKKYQERYIKAEVIYVSECGKLNGGMLPTCMVMVEHRGIVKPAAVTGNAVEGDNVYRLCRLKLGALQCKEEWSRTLDENYLRGGEVIN